MDCALCSGGTPKPSMFYGRGSIVVCHDCRARHDLPCNNTDRTVRGAVDSFTCIHRDRGCTGPPVFMDKLAEHLRSCRFVPCACPSRGCTFTAAPAALPQHFAEHHKWPVVHNLVYGHKSKLAAVPDPQSMVALVAESDGCVFVLYAFAVDTDTAVSVVCMRASEDAPEVANQFRCKLWVKGGASTGRVVVSSSFRVTSCDGPRRLPGRQGPFLKVPRQQLELLRGESGEPPALIIRIDKDGEQGR